MKIKYFRDTDTALLEFSGGEVVETREVSASVYLDLDKDGNLVSMTVEHAAEKRQPAGGRRRGSRELNDDRLTVWVLAIPGTRPPPFTIEADQFREKALGLNHVLDCRPAEVSLY